MSLLVNNGYGFYLVYPINVGEIYTGQKFRHWIMTEASPYHR